MIKKQTISTVLQNMRENEIPWVMEQIMADKTLSVENKATRISLLQTIHRHLTLTKMWDE